jgi:hypothetical protein
MTVYALDVSGCKNDDGGSDDICRVLATLSRILHRDVILARSDKRTVHPGTISCNLLAGYVQQHVQSDHLLLDEFQVRYIHSCEFVCSCNPILIMATPGAKLSINKQKYGAFCVYSHNMLEHIFGLI